MTLEEGAQTVIGQCLDVEIDEEVLVLNDSNDEELIESLEDELEERGIDHEVMNFEEPDSHGAEPPEEVAERMKQVDVVIAPTVKSLSHTEARKQANKEGTRVATLPTVSKKIWETSLQADYSRVKQITEKVYNLLQETEEVTVETPSGTELSFQVEIDTYHNDTGMIHEEGDFGNLPAGEPNGYPQGITGTLVLDHFPFSPDAEKVEIQDGKVVSVQSSGTEKSELEKAFENHPCSRNMAEFGFGTNPEATIIGNILQDEKVLGTVHIAFGDNCSYIPEGDERRNPCPIHWDAVCQNPTVKFDDTKILDNGKPVFME